MENNKTTDEVTTDELKEGLLCWYEAKMISRLDNTYNLYNQYKECPERMWYERPRTECNCD